MTASGPATMTAVLSAVREAVSDGREGFGEALAAVDGLPEAVASSARFAGSARHLAALSAALRRGDRARAMRHLGKLEGAAWPNANDRPHAVGDRVSVTRHRHGWEDGRIEARVTARSASAEGTWSYVAVADDGAEVEIGHTRDARPVR